MAYAVYKHLSGLCTDLRGNLTDAVDPSDTFAVGRHSNCLLTIAQSPLVKLVANTESVSLYLVLLSRLEWYMCTVGAQRI